MYDLPEPSPDFDAFEAVLLGKMEPEKAHIVELGMDLEVQKIVTEKCLGRNWFPPEHKDRGALFEQHAAVYHRLGYDFVPAWPEWPTHPPSKSRVTRDTAELAIRDRTWVEEGYGLITSEKEFDAFPWDDLRHDNAPLDMISPHLARGQKMTAGCTLFEHVLERLLGYEGLFYMLHDNEKLAGRVFHEWGSRVFDFYESAARRSDVGAIFHADDLGFKTSTMISPAMLGKHVFPWFKRFAGLAHNAGKPFFYHCCGNIYPEVIEDLIEEVGIDGYHSFEDVILSVTEFKARYGKRVAALGGVDMDKMSRLDEKGLRAYVKAILDECVPGGRFAIGAGNTVANYIPFENYMAMLDEARQWRAA